MYLFTAMEMVQPIQPSQILRYFAEYVGKVIEVWQPSGAMRGTPMVPG